MSLCPHCGASLAEQVLFCPRCGGAVSPVHAEDVTPPVVPAATEKLRAGSKSLAASSRDTTGEELPIPENIAAVVAYVTIVPAIVFLLLEPFKRNYFVRFHAFQHLFLWIAGFVFGIAAAILGTLFQLIPFMRVLMFPLAGLIALAWLFLWALLVVKAYHHQMFKLPVIGDLAEQQAGV